MPSLSRGRKLFGAVSASILALAYGEKFSASRFDVLDYVDPLIGTSDGGMLILQELQGMMLGPCMLTRLCLRSRISRSYTSFWNGKGRFRRL